MCSEELEHIHDKLRIFFSDIKVNALKLVLCLLASKVKSDCGKVWDCRQDSMTHGVFSDASSLKVQP